MDTSEARLISHSQPLVFNEAAILGKPNTPTPVGVFTLSKAYSTKLKSNILIFKHNERGIWSIHPNLVSRTAKLNSPTIKDNYASAGCIGIDPAAFNKLWHLNSAITLKIK